MSLARLWQSQGKRQAAYDLLAPVYNWFTEGFETVDLQDAKTLLTALETSSAALASSRVSAMASLRRPTSRCASSPTTHAQRRS